MARIRLSTTVDASLLEAARALHSGPTDAALVDDALRALLARNRAHEIDAGYAAYDDKPTDQPDEWGDPQTPPRRRRPVHHDYPRTGQRGRPGARGGSDSPALRR